MQNWWYKFQFFPCSTACNSFTFLSLSLSLSLSLFFFSDNYRVFASTYSGAYVYYRRFATFCQRYGIRGRAIHMGRGKKSSSSRPNRRSLLPSLPASKPRQNMEALREGNRRGIQKPYYSLSNAQKCRRVHHGYFPHHERARYQDVWQLQDKGTYSPILRPDFMLACDPESLCLTEYGEAI